jgi:hypothetical protein
VGSYTLKAEQATSGVPDHVEAFFGQNESSSVTLSIIADPPAANRQTLHLAYKSISRRLIVDANHTIEYSSDRVSGMADPPEGAWRDILGISFDMVLRSAQEGPEFPGMDKLWKKIESDPSADFYLASEQQIHGEKYLRTLFSQCLPFLPTTAVAVGETWQQALPQQSGSLHLALHETGTLKSVTGTADGQIGEVNLSGEMEIPLPDFHASVTKTISASALLNIDTGQPIKTELVNVMIWHIPGKPMPPITTKFVATFTKQSASMHGS